MGFIKNNIHRLFGFRSGVPYKKILAVVYYLVCILAYVICIVTPPPVTGGVRDVLILRISTTLLFLYFISPAICLSETPLRDKLPIFRKRTKMDSIMGMIIWGTLVLYFFWLSESFHTASYRQQFSAYITQAFEAFIEAGQ